MTPQSSFYWEDLLRTTGQRTASPPALRNCSKDVEEVSMHATVVKGWRADKLTSWEKVAENQEEQMSLWKILELFYPWEVVRLGSSIFSGNYLTIRRPVVSVFPEHRVPRSWSPSWTPIRVCWRSGLQWVVTSFCRTCWGKMFSSSSWRSNVRAHVARNCWMLFLCT